MASDALPAPRMRGAKIECDGKDQRGRPRVDRIEEQRLMAATLLAISQTMNQMTVMTTSTSPPQGHSFHDGLYRAEWEPLAGLKTQMEVSSPAATSLG